MKKTLTTIIYVFAILFAVTATSAFASIAGSTLTSMNKYMPGITNMLAYDCYNANDYSVDYEWIYTVSIQYISNMNVLAGLEGEGNESALNYNGAVGEAVLARWDSDEAAGSGYGAISGGGHGYFTNEVAIDASMSGNAVLTYYLVGDYGFGITNTLTISEQEPAVGVSPAIQGENSYRSFDVKYQLEIQNLIANNAVFNLSYISNNWPVTGPAATASLPPLGTETINATVSIPASAVVGQIETSTVIAVCASDNSISNAGLLITECLSFFNGTNIYCNDFNSWPPAGWSLYELGDPAGWGPTNPGADGTGACAFHNDDDVPSGCDDWLVSPAMDLTPVGGFAEMNFTFDSLIKYASYYDYNGVMISTGNIDPASNDYVELLEVGNTDLDWTDRKVDLSTYIGSNPVYLAFRYQGDYAHEWYVDNPCVVAGEEVIPGIVTGKVSDVDTSAAIPNATVNFQAASVQEQALTGADGLYEKAMLTNTYTAIASAPGYYPQTQSVNVIQGSYSALNFALKTTFVSNPPMVATEAAYPVTWDFAVLKGIANPNGIQSYVYFEYGVDTNYGFSGRLYDIGDETNTLNVVETSPQLMPSYTYHYRLVAYNSAGTNYGADQVLTTIASPVNMPAMWFQPVNILSGVAASQFATNHSSPFDARAADDFMYSSATTHFSQVRWWTREWNGAPPYVSPYAFNIYLYTNYPGGAGCYPTNVIQTWTFPLSECHEELFETNYLMYSYWAELSPTFQPEAGVHYWLSIQPVVNFTPQIGLGLSAYDVNVCTAMQVFALAGISDWTTLSSEQDIAYVLYPIPEPVMFLILIAGLSLLLMKKRR